MLLNNSCLSATTLRIIWSMHMSAALRIIWSMHKFSILAIQQDQTILQQLTTQPQRVNRVCSAAGLAFAHSVRWLCRHVIPSAAVGCLDWLDVCSPFTPGSLWHHCS